MHRKLPLVAGFFAAAITLTPLASPAIAGAPVAPVAHADGSVTHLVQYGGWRDRDYRDRGWDRDHYWYRCRIWRHRCAERWGWGGWEFRRCLWRHGCGGGHRYRYY